MMHGAKYSLYLSSLALAASAVAQTAFEPFPGRSAIHDALNWTNGLPNAKNPGTIAIDGSGHENQAHTWMRFANVVVEGGATLNLAQDLGARGGVLTINDATIHASDDIFTGNSGKLIFNEGSASTCADAFLAQDGRSNKPSSIVINGGTHTAGTLFGSNPNNNFLVMTGGQATADEFRFDGTGNSIGGSAVLLSASRASTLSMEGTTDIRSDWSGSWTISSFNGAAWRDELIHGGWTFNDVAINGTLFDSKFKITNGGQTLSLKP